MSDEEYGQDLAALLALLADEGVQLAVISPCRPLILQGTLGDGAPCGIRGFGDRVRLRAWAPGSVWQRTITDGDGSTREVPDVVSAVFAEDVDGWRWGEAAKLPIEDLEVALRSLIEAESASPPAATTRRVPGKPGYQGCALTC